METAAISGASAGATPPCPAPGLPAPPGRAWRAGPAVALPRAIVKPAARHLPCLLLALAGCGQQFTLRVEGDKHLQSALAAELTVADGSLIDFGADAEREITIVNSGAREATLDAAPELPAPFGYAGGAFPGTGGDCTLAIAPGSCTVALSYTPESAWLLGDGDAALPRRRGPAAAGDRAEGEVGSRPSTGRLSSSLRGARMSGTHGRTA